MATEESREMMRSIVNKAVIRSLNGLKSFLCLDIVPNNDLNGLVKEIVLQVLDDIFPVNENDIDVEALKK